MVNGGRNMCTLCIPAEFWPKNKDTADWEKMDICWYSVIEAWLCNLLTNTNVRQWLQVNYSFMCINSTVCASFLFVCVCDYRRLIREANFIMCPPGSTRDLQYHPPPPKPQSRSLLQLCSPVTLSQRTQKGLGCRAINLFKCYLNN